MTRGEVQMLCVFDEGRGADILSRATSHPCCSFECVMGQGKLGGRDYEVAGGKKQVCTGMQVGTGHMHLSDTTKVGVSPTKPI